MTNYNEKIIEILIGQGLYMGSSSQFNDKDFDDIFKNIDSLGLLNFIIEIEEQFSVEIPEEFLDKNNFVSLSSFSDMIMELSNKKDISI